MQGRLIPNNPASGRREYPLTLQEVVKAAQAKAHRDTSVQSLRRAMTKLARQSMTQENPREVLDVPGPPEGAVPPARGRGLSWSPEAAEEAVLALQKDTMEKEAFLLSAGRRLAASLAARGGRMGRVGRFLQRDVRSPVQIARSGRGSVNVSVRNPVPKPKPPPVPKDTGGPYRAPGTVASPPATPPMTPQQVPDRFLPDMTRHAKLEGASKPKGKSLTRALLPGAALIGTGALLYKGLPAAANFAQQASNAPMAYNMGHQQFMYGYSPEGQAQF
jgi:hypothetical protein